MAKKVIKIIKLQIPAGKATPAPPIGPALGAAKVNIAKFVNEFNLLTQAQVGDIIPVILFVYSDNSCTFVTKSSPVSRLILKELGIESGSKVPNRDKVGKLTKTQVKKIAEKKGADLRVRSSEAAYRLIEGTARSMGVDVVEG